MTKYIPFIFVSIITLSACNESEQGISESDARETMNSFFTSLSLADSMLMNHITTDDFMLYEHGEVWNRDSLLSLMAATEGRIWEIRDFETTSDGNIIHVNYYNVSREPVGRSWLESALLVNENGRLKIKFMHSTKLYLNE